MVTDDELRARIVEAAAGVFAEHGYGGTRVRMVAARAGVSPRTVRRLTGGRAALFEVVMEQRVTSTAAERFAAAAADPAAMPPLAVILATAQDVFVAPERSWEVLELEALTRARVDDDLRAIEAGRIRRRRHNVNTLVAQVRSGGGLDDDVTDDAVVLFSMALSAGLALLDPVTEARPTTGEWAALMARIGASLAPDDMLLEPEFAADRRPWRVRVDVSDRPGGLIRLMRAMGALHAYTVSVSVIGAEDGFRTFDLALSAPPGVSADAILAAAMSAGRNAYVTQGRPEDALDLLTRALDGAAELVTNPGRAPMGASRLARADSYEVVDAAEGPADRTDLLRLQWTPERHVLLHRSWAPFARAERTRASAALRLSAAIAAMAGDVNALGWVEPIKDGAVWVRLAVPEDADAVAAMHERCSERTRYLRYVATTDWREVQLRRLSGGHAGATLVAVNDHGAIVGLGNVFPERPGDRHTAEIAVLVEDALQGRGIGSALIRRQLQMAARLGFAEVMGEVLAENRGMLHVLGRTGLSWSHSISAGVSTLRAPLPTTAPTEFPPQGT